MKAKRIIALAMSVAMAVGTASLLAACTPGDEDVNTGCVEDTRIWYAVGKDTKGTLKDQGWSENNTTYKFERDESVTDVNQFTLDLDIYAGDVSTGLAFKFLWVANEGDTGDWTHQYGIHNFDNCEGEGTDSVIKIDGVTTFTTAQDNGDDGTNMALVKGQEGTYRFTLKTTSDTDSNPVFSVTKLKSIEVTHDMYLRGDFNNFSAQNMIAMTETVGSGETHTTWSAQLEVTKNHLWRTADGTEVDADADDLTIPDGTGTYSAVQLFNSRDSKVYVVGEDSDYKTVEHAKFDGKGDYNVILLPEGNYTITYDQVDNSVTIIAGTHKMHFIGSFNNWAEGDANYQLNENNGVWTGIITIEEDNTELKLFNALNGSYYTTSDLGSDNIKLNKGTYIFKFEEQGNVVKYDEFAYFIVGTFVDEDGNKVNFGDEGIIEGLHPKFVKDGNLMTATFTATDVYSLYGLGSWGLSNPDAVFVAQIVAGSYAFGVNEFGVANSGGNAINVAAGTWTITIDTTNWSYTVTEAQA